MVPSPKSVIVTTLCRAFAGGFVVSDWQGYGYWFTRGAPGGPADSA
ncbi:hypothetical protein R6258_05350 [Halomonas sp. HP20-15]|nr:hypothetical protein [Halomonas sp. HP20-15]MDW5376341.1 hypothetical protein [Halomonas sp. HP20-15]